MRFQERTGRPVRGRIATWRIHEPGPEAKGNSRRPPSLREHQWGWGPGGVRSLDAEPIFSRSNQIQIDWAFITAMCLSGNRDYRIRGMYLEFENVADPEDEVTIPTYGEDEGREYYQNLVYSSDRDFLRVPLIADPTLSIEEGFEDFFDTGEGNKLTFFAMSQGTAGFHGKTYGAGSNSKVFGYALVATPDFQDPTKDRIFARVYGDDADEQVLAQASKQIGVTWSVALGTVPS